MRLLWVDLLNSDWHDHRGSGRSEDRLENPRWVEGFLARWGLADAGELDAGARDRLKELRSLLRRMVEALDAGDRPGDDDLAGLNAVLARAPVVRGVTRAGNGYQVNLAPLSRGWDRVLGEIAASFAEMLARGDPSRVKICENPDCRWVFYDESRNRGRRWCEGNICGSLVKVRRFRQRRREEAKDSGKK